MIKQNEFQAYRKKNKTKSSHCYVKHTVLTLLLLSPLGSNAIDSTQKLRGKEKNLGNLSYESIDSVIHVPDESGNIGLSTGEGESPHLSQILHESSMLDEAKVQKHFFEQAKMASDKNSTMNSTDLVPVGGHCNTDDDCESKICEVRLSYLPEVHRCVSAPGALMPNGAWCRVDEDCVTGRCTKDWKCADKLPNGETCWLDDDCENDYCAWSIMCGEITCCADLPEKMPNGRGCLNDEACESGRCSSSFKCEDKIENGKGCGENEDCVSDYCVLFDVSCGGLGCCRDPPPPSASPKRCFSSETLVTHSERGLIPISEIEVGDYVLDSKFDGSFSRVFALEQNHYGKSAFYQLLSSTGTLLELTDRHMVYLRNKALPVPARDIQVGDVLKSDDPQNNMEVGEIKIIHRDGYYNPVTESGRIVLNDGVVASSFSVARSSSSNFFDGSTELIHWHTLSHLANAPLRFVCKAVSFSLCSDENYLNEEGLHKFVVLLKRASNFSDWAQAIVFPFIFGLGVIFTVLELMYDKAEALLEVASSAEAGAGLLTFAFSLVAALAVPGMLALRKRYFL